MPIGLRTVVDKSICGNPRKGFPRISNASRPWLPITCSGGTP
jgi:hypothetical protein